MHESKSLQTRTLQPVIYELGAAAYLCQQFETSLLLLVSMLTANEGVVTSESFKKGLDAHSDKTLGRLASIFKTTLSLPENYVEYIKKGVEKRNSLIHGFVMRNTSKLLSAEGRLEVVIELQEAQRFIDERLQSLNEVLDHALQVFGGNLDQLRREANFRFEPDIVDEIIQH
jgi:hypothetical protein